LKLQRDELISSVAFNFNLRRYEKGIRNGVIIFLSTPYSVGRGSHMAFHLQSYTSKCLSLKPLTTHSDGGQGESLVPPDTRGNAHPRIFLSDNPFRLSFSVICPCNH
jgi:hypothetical protein